MASSSPPVELVAPPAIMIQPASPRFPSSSSHRRIAIAIDLSDESAYAVKWAVNNYLRKGDTVILLHVRPTSVLYGADWGPVESPKKVDKNLQDHEKKEHEKEQLETDFDKLTNTKADDVAMPLVEANIPFKIHIVKDHDMKERLCLEVERLGLSAVIMGSRGFGASRKGSKGGRLGSVSDYCVHHCVCPVVVVRYPYDEKVGEEELGPVPEEEGEYHDAFDKNTEAEKAA